MVRQVWINDLRSFNLTTSKGVDLEIIHEKHSSQQCTSEDDGVQDGRVEDVEMRGMLPDCHFRRPLKLTASSRH